MGRQGRAVVQILLLHAKMAEVYSELLSLEKGPAKKEVMEGAFGLLFPHFCQKGEYKSRTQYMLHKPFKFIL
jgi:hypothetical protein